MKHLRTLSTRRLVLLVVGTALAASGVGVAAVTAAAKIGSPPPAEPLAQALHDAAAAPKPAGISARVTYTNSLLPSLAGLSRNVSPLLAGASGRLWLTGDGSGRIELQSSSSADTEIVWSKTEATIYDGTSNTVYRLTLPADTAQPPASKQAPPGVAQIGSFLTRLAQVATVSGASPTVLAGQGAYTVRMSPTDTSSLLGGATVGWDASTGVPLEFGVYARGQRSPVVELKVTSISYGPVPASDVQISPPPGAKVVQLPAPSGGAGQGTEPPPVTGLANVQAKLPFTLRAPASLAGKSRSEVRLLGKDAALLVYGRGLSALAVVERQPAAGGAQGSLPSTLGALPSVTIAGTKATELHTPLGTVIRFEQGGVSFLVAASLPAATVEQAAAGLVA